jgi:hypothetical protein
VPLPFVWSQGTSLPTASPTRPAGSHAIAAQPNRVAF